MTYKSIVFPKHALDQMDDRGVTRAMVRETLATGDVFEVHQRSGGARRHGREKRYASGALRVVYFEDAHEVTLVTIMWKE
jgi:hypothetical protein